MDNLTAIEARNIGKKFRIGELNRMYKTLRDSISDALGSVTNAAKGGSKDRKAETEFWALKDISFDVKQGEAVGIIGHNGAGKSTLLKILARITEPTEGSAEIRGRVGSLLEVGTGFHNELTGRENIYLSGAILGMTKRDIDRRFEEIVEFAGVGRFVDTPIKHYSTGMGLRLGFAVAAHLEPDILLVDEVLAVGDLEFQKKCLNKMENVATEGRTVLFVSHNMASVKELCRTAIVLKNGSIDFHGDVVKGIQHYSRNILNIGAGEPGAPKTDGWINIRIEGQIGDPRVLNSERYDVSGDLNLPYELRRPLIHCIMENAEGNQIVHNTSRRLDELEPGLNRVKADFPAMYLRPGVYTLFFKLIGERPDGSRCKFSSERLVIDVADGTGLFSGKVYATVLPPVKWTVTSVDPVMSGTGESAIGDRTV